MSEREAWNGNYQFDFERLDVYQKSQEFMGSIFRVTRSLPREYQYSLADQLRRAGDSIALNLAEGAGRWAPREKAHFYAIALGSSAECGAILTICAIRRRGL